MMIATYSDLASAGRGSSITQQAKDRVLDLVRVVELKRGADCTELGLMGVL